MDESINGRDLANVLLQLPSNCTVRGYEAGLAIEQPNVGEIAVFHNNGKVEWLARPATNV